MNFFFAVCGLILFGLVLSLRGRVHRLERMMEEQGSLHIIQSDSSPLSASMATSRKTVQPVVAVKHAEKTGFDGFIAWVQEDWLLKLGVLLLVMSFGWLTTYAFLHEWIGPMGRIVLGLGAGVLFMVFGWERMKKYVHQGGVFLVLGSTTVLLTLFAAREMYNFFTPTLALGAMFLVAASVAVASVKYRNTSLAFVGFLFAGIAPLLTNASTVNDVGLFSYLLVITFGTLWVVELLGQRELIFAALMMVTWYSSPYFSAHPPTAPLALLLFAYVFAALFFVMNIRGILKLQGKGNVFDLVTPVWNGLFFFAWILTTVHSEWQKVIVLAWGIAYAVGAYLLWKSTQKREPFYAYIGVALAMLAVSTSIQFEWPMIAVAFMIEFSVILLVAQKFLRDARIVAWMSALFCIPMVMSLFSIGSFSWELSMFHQDSFVLFVIILAFLGLGVFFTREIQGGKAKELLRFPGIFFTLSAVYSYIFLWLSLHASFQDAVIATMISLLTYTIIGLGVYFYGLKQEKRNIQFHGGILVGCVVVRLLLVDVWDMELAGRTAMFFLIGGLLVATAFFGKKRK